MSQDKRTNTQTSKSDSRHSLPPVLFTVQPKHPPHFEPYSQNYRSRPYSLGTTLKANSYYSQGRINSQNKTELDTSIQSSSGLLESVTNKVSGFLTGMKNAVSSYFKPKDELSSQVLHPSTQEDNDMIKRLKESKPDSTRIQKIDFTPIGSALNTSLKENKLQSETQSKHIPHKINTSHPGFLNNSLNTDLINGSNMVNFSMAQDNKNILNLSSNSGNSKFEGSTIIRKKEKKFSLIKKLNYCLDLYEDRSRTYAASQEGGFNKNLRAVLTEDAKVPVAKKMYQPILEFRWNRTMERFDAIHNQRKRKGDMDVESLNNSHSRGILGDTSLEIERSGFSQIRLKKNKISNQVEKESPIASNRIVVEMLGFPAKSSITIQNKNPSVLRTLPYFEATNEEEDISAIRKKKTPAKNPIFEEDKCNRSTDTDSESVHYNPKFVSETGCQTSPLRSTPKIQPMRIEGSPKTFTRLNSDRRIIQNIIPEKREDSKTSGSQTPPRAGSSQDIQIKIEEGTQNSSQNPNAIINENSKSNPIKPVDKIEIKEEIIPKPDVHVNKPIVSGSSLLTGNLNSANQGSLHNTPKVNVPEKKEQLTTGIFFNNIGAKTDKPSEKKEEVKDEKKEEKPIIKPGSIEKKKPEDSADDSTKAPLIFNLNEYKISKPASNDAATNPFLPNKSQPTNNQIPPVSNPGSNQKAEVTNSKSFWEEKSKLASNPTNPSSTQPISNPVVNPTNNLFNKTNTTGSTGNLHGQNLFAHLIPSGPVKTNITLNSNPNPKPIIIAPQPSSGNKPSESMEIIDTGSNNGTMKTESNNMAKSIEMGNTGPNQISSTNMFQNGNNTQNLFNVPAKPINFSQNNPSNNGFMGNSMNTGGANNVFQTASINRPNMNSNQNPMNLGNNLFNPSNPSSSQNLFNSKPNNTGNMFSGNQNNSVIGNNTINNGNMGNGNMGNAMIGGGNMGGGMSNEPANPFLNKNSSSSSNNTNNNNNEIKVVSEDAMKFLGTGGGNDNNNANMNGRLIRKIMAPVSNKDKQRAF